MKLPMFEFKTEVRLYSHASPEEVVARLASLTSPPLSFKKTEREKPLRGRAALREGLLRWPIHSSRFASARVLKFDILEAASGSVLSGAFAPGRPLRIWALAWLVYGNVYSLYILIRGLTHWAGLKELSLDVLQATIGLGGCWAVALGYIWVVVAVGRRRDRSLIRLLRIVLASESGAMITKSLLSPDDPKRSFIDEPRTLETK